MHPPSCHSEFANIRNAQLDDANRIAEMVGQLAVHHGDTPTVTPDDISRDIAGPQPWLHILVAEADGALIGYAALCSLIRLQFGQRGMDLHHLFVDPAHRSRGIGRSLVAASIARARALTCSYLSVGTHPENHAAQSFYVEQGFQRRDAAAPRFLIRLEA